MTTIATPAFLTADDFTAIAGALTFRPEPHTYHVGMTQMPSVTQVLRAVGVSVDFERLVEDGKLERALLLEAREIGNAVHRAAHYYDENTLDRATVDPRAEQGLQNWIDWRELTGFVPVLLETPLHDPGWLYAGTIDRAGYFTKFEGWKRNELAVVDLKWGDPESAGARWQTAAYAALLALALASTSRWHPGPAGLWRPRYSVHLQGARATLARYGDLRDFTEFQAFLTTYRCQIAQRKAARA